MSIKAMNWAWQVKGLKPGEKLVLMKLADHANDSGLCWPGKSSIAEDCEVSKRTADAYVARLSELKLITVTRRKVGRNHNETNVYQLHIGQMGLFDAEGSADSAVPQNLHQCKNSPRGSADSAQKGANSAPEPPGNQNTQPPSSSAAGAAADGYESAKGKKLEGETLNRFNRFWSAFDDKRGKAAAADAWLKVEPTIRKNLDLFHRILAAARAYANNRSDLVADGKTPKMAEGWLNDRRWEDDPGKQNGEVFHEEQPGKPWFACQNEILIKASNQYGIIQIDYPDFKDLLAELVSRMEAAGEPVPEPLRIKLLQMEKSS